MGDIFVLLLAAGVGSCAEGWRSGKAVCGNISRDAGESKICIGHVYLRASKEMLLFYINVDYRHSLVFIYKEQVNKRAW